MVDYNGYFWFVMVLLGLAYVLDALVDWLNVRNLRETIPQEFAGVYDAEKYAKSQRYLRTNTRFGLVQSTIMLPLTIAFIALGGFGWVNRLAMSAGGGMIVSGLLFGAILVLISQVVGLPFSIYDTFVIEERFGFNRTTVKTFILDRLKGLALTALIGAPVFALVLWFFSGVGRWAWLYCWAALTLIQVMLMYIAPVVILPLFNKFIPLEDGDLRGAIEDYAAKQQFKLSGIFKIDGSKRSSKSNAYFTGFGRWRRIALFDTLIEKHTVRELVAVLAHEVGHYKKGHILKQLVIGICTSGAMLYILSLFLRRLGLYEAFGVAYEPFASGALPIYAGIVFFGFLFTPINLLLSIFSNVLSRGFEYEADAYAAETTGESEPMISALKKLSVDNLSNLTPHPLKVFLQYSHPPVLQRIEAIRRGFQ
jgi:STE24 endopeptidase